MFNRVNGDGNVVSKTRKIGDNFTKVIVGNGLDLFISQGNEVKLTVEADENLHEIITTEVKNGQLRIATEKNIFRSKARKVYLTVVDIEELVATSGSDVFSENVLKVDELTVETSSGADLKIEVEANTISTNSSSGADLRISGKTIKHNSNASSGSSIRAYNLESKESYAHVSSGADISIHASDYMNANASSGGDIKLKGNPNKFDKRTSSGGRVSKR